MVQRKSKSSRNSGRIPWRGSWELRPIERMLEHAEDWMAGELEEHSLRPVDLIDVNDPSYWFIMRAAFDLMRFGFDPADDDILLRAIRVGQEDYRRGVELNGFDADEASEEPDRFALKPGQVVYYMRIGNRVKIGVTANLRSRIAAINPEEVMVTEPGNRILEKVRHEQFSDLRVYGEWFELGERLAVHIEELRRIDQQVS